MAYTVTNYPSKKALKDAANIRKERVEVYQPGPFGPDVKDGRCYIEGPHYPQPHKFYANCDVKGGVIVPGTVK
jgi:hypothetical protein